MSDYYFDVTQQFIDEYSNPDNQSSWQWRMISEGILPSGVNPDNEQVQNLIRLAKNQYER